MPPVREPSRRQLGSRSCSFPDSARTKSEHHPALPERARFALPQEASSLLRGRCVALTSPSYGPYSRSCFPVRLSGVSATFLADCGGQTLSGLHRSTETRLPGTVLFGQQLLPKHSPPTGQAKSTPGANLALLKPTSPPKSPLVSLIVAYRRTSKGWFRRRVSRNMIIYWMSDSNEERVSRVAFSVNKHWAIHMLSTLFPQ